MRYSKTILTTVFVVLVISMTGCGDSFFTRPPQGELTADNFYNTEADLRKATSALYNQVWFQWNDKASFSIGDARAGNIWSNDDAYNVFTDFSESSGHPRIAEAWRSLYIVVNQSNLVIQNIRNQAGGIDEEVRNEAIAEARFMRGVAYSYLGQLWGPVPIVTNTPRLIDQPDRRRNRRQDVLQFAINDFKYAVEHLPRMQEEPGRVTEWSARGMLARMYWTMANFVDQGGPTPAEPGELSSRSEYLTMAKNQAQMVITQSGMELREDFGDLFLLSEEDRNNRQESLFSLKWVYSPEEGGTWGVHNTAQAYFAPSGDVTGAADGWGGGMGVQAFVVETFGVQDDVNDERRPESFMMHGDTYPEIMQEQGGYTYEATLGVDAGYTGGSTAIKKYVIGRASDNDGRVGTMRTGIDTYMLRLSEVLLTYAQVSVAQNGGSTSDGPAIDYYDRVRTRAGLEPDQDGMLSREEVFMEKWRELVFEGQCWFMLVRWHMSAPEAAMTFMEDQGRNRQVLYDEDGNFVLDQGGSDNLPIADGPNRASNVFVLPYPETDLSQNELLREDPVSYDFSDQGSGS